MGKECRALPSKPCRGSIAVPLDEILIAAAVARGGEALPPLPCAPIESQATRCCADWELVNRPLSWLLLCSGPSPYVFRASLIQDVTAAPFSRRTTGCKCTWTAPPHPTPHLTSIYCDCSLDTRASRNLR